MLKKLDSNFLENYTEKKTFFLKKTGFLTYILVMRPTFLQFRSPKERTPDPYDVNLTCEGRTIGCRRAKSPSFGREKRFKQYIAESKKTGFMVGPGSYNKMPQIKIKGGCLYKPLHGLRGDPRESFYVGQLLVRSPICQLEKELITIKKSEISIKKSEISRLTTASDMLNPNHSRMNFHKVSPMFRSGSHGRISPKS